MDWFNDFELRIDMILNTLIYKNSLLRVPTMIFQSFVLCIVRVFVGMLCVVC